MRSILFRPLSVLALIACLVSPLAAEGGKVALVIGNSAYATGPLRNPANDAEDMAEALRSIGFTVALGRDADRKAMYQLVEQFGVDLRGAEIALFYYSGHGVQSDGENYLIPVGAEISVASDVEIEGVQLQRVIGRMATGGAATSLIILDACRNNPFPQASRGMERGLAVVGQKPPESVIVYSTEAGETADDGSGRNGVFTAALLRNITRSEELTTVLRDVNAQVRGETNQRQRPAKYDNLTMGVYLAGKPVPAAPAPAPAAKSSAALDALLNEPVATSEILLDGRMDVIRVSETNLGRLMADSIRLAAKADVAFVNGGGLRDSIPAGPISRRQILKVMPFGNAIQSTVVTGAELAAILEHGLSKLPAQHPGFPQFSNLSYVLDASKPAGSRASSIKVGGLPLDPKRNYVLAGIDYIFSGGDGYPKMEGRTVTACGVDSEVLAAYLKSLGTVTAASVAPRK